MLNARKAIILITIMLSLTVNGMEVYLGFSPDAMTYNNLIDQIIATIEESQQDIGRDNSLPPFRRANDGSMIINVKHSIFRDKFGYVLNEDSLRQVVEKNLDNRLATNYTQDATVLALQIVKDQAAEAAAAATSFAAAGLPESEDKL